MSNIKINDLRNLSSSPSKDCLEQIGKALANNTPLYSVIKEDIVVTFDYVNEYEKDDGSGIELVFGDNDESFKYYRGEVFRLSKEALKELYYNKRIDRARLGLVFIDKQSSLKFASISRDYFIGLEDVYIKKISNATSKSKKVKTPYLQAIDLALEDLKKKNSTEEIFDWIKAQTQKSEPLHNCFTDIFCEGEQIVEFCDAKGKHFIMLNDKTLVRKSTFGEQCSRARSKYLKK